MKLDEDIYRSLKYRYVVFRNRLTFKARRYGSFFRLQREGKIPNVVVHEKYGDIVKWAARLLTIVGIILSAISLPVQLSVATTVVLTIFEQILERIVLSVTFLFVHPFPEEWDNSSWEGNLYVGTQYGWSVGLIFNDEQMAYEFFETLSAWTGGETLDMGDNIICSFVDRGDSYVAIIAPSPERDPFWDASEEYDQELIEERKLREQLKLSIQIVFYKSFPNPPNANFRMFKNYYQGDGINLFAAYTEDAPDRVGPADGLPDGIHYIDDIPEFRLADVSIYNEEELESGSMEAQFIRYALQEIELDRDE